MLSGGFLNSISVGFLNSINVMYYLVSTTDSGGRFNWDLSKFRYEMKWVLLSFNGLFF